ncbi:MAG: ATP-binding protein [Firmicutes bacterium]|jgi:predicted transcriptional regulator|nr:ATP-binding protein [Bacillota bacterium]
MGFLASLFRRSTDPSRRPLPRRLAARLAVYDSPGVAPRLVEVQGTKVQEFMDELAATTYSLAQEKGGRIPFTALKEVVENLIHAAFHEVTITISPDGNTIRIADGGGGIPDKEKALIPGYSSAAGEIKRYIKGVGSGLPVAQEALQALGGILDIDDNLSGGAVVTLSVDPVEKSPPGPQVPAGDGTGQTEYSTRTVDDGADGPCLHPAAAAAGLSRRQEEVLILLAEHEEIGPSSVARKAGISLSTAYRDLVYLEELGLVESKPNGKRVLTPAGGALLAALRGTDR